MKLSRFFFPLTILAFVIAASSCEDTTNVNIPEQEFAAEVAGRVMSYPGGDPVAGASYEILGTSVTGVTDSRGMYRITGLDMGSYDLLVSAPGHAASRVTIPIQPPNAGQASVNLHVTRNVYLLERSASLAVTVYQSRNGEPAGDAAVDIVSWGFPEEALGHAVDDDSVLSSGRTDANGTVTMTGLPAVTATIVVRPYDGDGDGVADYGTAAEEVELAPDSRSRKTIVLREETEQVQIVRSNLPDYSYGSMRDPSLLYIVFSTEMDTSPSATAVQMSTYYGSGYVPCTVEWTSEIRLEIKPDMLYIEDGDVYYLSLGVSSAAGVDYNDYWELVMFTDSSGAVGGDCPDVVTDLTATTPGGFDFDTRYFDLTWTAVSCADGYRIYAKDDRDNPDWVLIKEDPTDYEFGTVNSAVSLPARFDRYGVDALQTPLAGIEVTFSVVPERAEDPAPGGSHGTVVVTDATAPTVIAIHQVGSGKNVSPEATVLMFEYDFSEYLSQAVADPVVEIVEAGGDPSFALDPQDATWRWKDARSGGRVEFTIPAGTDASGDQIRIAVDGFADMSGNGVGGTYLSEWRTIGEDYIFDFESGPQGWFTNEPTYGWEWGTPSYGLNTAHSGTHCWGTDLDYIYGNGWSVSVFSPLLGVPLAAPTLRFWTWYDIPDNGDYCKLYVHAGGSVDSLYYYSGYGTSWTQRDIDIGAYAGQSIRIEFRFESDASYTDYGFFFDDVELFSAAP